MKWCCMLAKCNSKITRTNNIHYSRLFTNCMLTLAVVVYGTPLSNPFPRAANHRAQPMLSSSTVVNGRISWAIYSFLYQTPSPTQHHCIVRHAVTSHRMISFHRDPNTENTDADAVIITTTTTTIMAASERQSQVQTLLSNQCHLLWS